MSYLKALGILRLVAEQKDPDALGCWRDGVFVLSSKLDQDELARFFLNDYSPTPIIVPWSGGDFFGVKRIGNKGPFKKTPTSTAVIEAFLGSDGNRLALYRDSIGAALATLDSCGIAQKSAMEEKERKSRFISSFRAKAAEPVVEWIDACAVMSDEKASFSALLGSGGGSDGNTHFSDNFMQNLWEVLPDFDAQRKTTGVSSIKILKSALWGNLSKSLVAKRTSTLFDAGAVGGPNAGQGFERVSLGNPWSIILCLEGTMLLAGCVIRRHGISESARAAFPFQVRLTSLRTDSTTSGESAGREIWMPLWSGWASKTELVTLFSEGRASLGGKQVERGVDFARAAASLGVDRGIEGFQRFAVVRGRVGGDNYNTASSLGYFEVRARPDVDLLRECDLWIKQLARVVSDKEAPPRFKSALRRVESAIFEFCKYGGTPRFAEILCALGHTERELANGEKFRKDKGIHPLAGLSQDWMRAANDNSMEFALALALAGIWDQERKIGLLRGNLEPVGTGVDRHEKTFANWLDQGRAVVWNSADLSRNLAAVLDRRVMDGSREGCKLLPLSSRCPAPLSAISCFISGRVDDERIEDLLWGLMLVKQATLEHPIIADAPPLPRSYALLKLLFLPHLINTGNGEAHVKLEPAVLTLLRSGRVGEACAIAARRLRSSGVVPMPYHTGKRVARDDEWAESSNSVDVRRLVAALLFPISRNDVYKLTTLVLRQGEKSSTAAK
jgi:CRISPR-associated protein Csx17